MLYLGPWAGQLGWKYSLSLSCFPDFLHKKRHFWSRIDHYPRFFGLFCMSQDFMWLCFEFEASLTLSKLACRRKRAPGKAFMSSNRPAFQAQLPPRDPKVAQETPRRPPQEGLKIIFNFFQTSPGGLLGSPGSLGSSRGAVGLEKLVDSMT